MDISRSLLVITLMAFLSGCNGDGEQKKTVDTSDQSNVSQNRNIIINSRDSVVKLKKSNFVEHGGDIFMSSNHESNAVVDISKNDIVVTRNSPLDKTILTYSTESSSSQGDGVIVIVPSLNGQVTHSLPPTSLLMTSSSSLDIDIKDKLGVEFPSGAKLTQYSSNHGVLKEINSNTLNYSPDNPKFIGTDTIVYTLEVVNGNDTSEYVGFIDLAISDPVTEAPTSQDFTVPLPLDVGKPHTIDVAPLVSDIDNDKLTLVSVKTFDTDIIVDSLNALTFNVFSKKSGHYRIAYTVTDSRGGYSSSYVSFTVGSSTPVADNFPLDLQSNPAPKLFTIDTSSAISDPSHIDNSTLEITAVELLGDSKGLTVNMDPDDKHNLVLNYPGKNVTGNFSILYQVSNGINIDTGLIAITITNPLAGTPRIELGTIELLTNLSVANGRDLNRAKVKVVDALGLPVANTIVNWKASSSVVLSASSTTTSSDGYAYISAKSAQPGISDLTAQAGGVDDQLLWQFSADATGSQFDGGIVTDKNKAIANGKDSNRVSVKVINNNNQPVAGAVVRWKGFSSLNISPGPETLTDENGVTNVSLSTLRVGSQNIIATLANGSKVSTSTDFISNPDNVQIMKGSIRRDNAYNQIANNTDTHSISVKVVDDKQQPVSGISIVWAVDKQVRVVSNSASALDGFATATFSTNKANQYTVQASLKGQSESIDINFIGDSATAVLKPGSLRITKNYSKADGYQENIAEVKLLDINDNPVPEQDITWFDTTGNAHFTSSNTMTDKDGVATVTATSNNPFLDSLSASFNQSTLSAPWQFVSDLDILDVTLDHDLIEGRVITPVINGKHFDSNSITYLWEIDNNENQIFGDTAVVSGQPISDRVMTGKSLLLEDGEMGLPIQLTLNVTSTDNTQTKKVVVRYLYMMVDEDNVFSAGSFWYARRNDGHWKKLGLDTIFERDTDTPELGGKEITQSVWVGYGFAQSELFDNLLLLDDGSIVQPDSSNPMPSWLDPHLPTEDIFSIAGDNDQTHLQESRVKQRCFARRQRQDQSFDFWCTNSPDNQDPQQGNSRQLINEPVVEVYGHQTYWLVLLASGKVGYLDHSGFHQKFNTYFDEVNTGIVNIYSTGKTGQWSAFVREDGSLLVAQPRVSTQKSDIYQFPGLANKVKQIVFSDDAVAILTMSGDVKVAGDAQSGGDSSNVNQDLNNVSSLYATKSSFSALRNDGRVISWGNSQTGGDNSNVEHELVSITSLSSSTEAFAAVTTSGKVIAWGGLALGGDISNKPELATNVHSVVGIAEGFVALRPSEKTIVWGGSKLESENTAPMSDLRMLRPNSPLNQKSVALVSSTGEIALIGRRAYAGFTDINVVTDFFKPENITTDFTVTDL